MRNELLMRIRIIWRNSATNAGFTTELCAYLTYGRAKQQQECDGHLRRNE